jgi:hypothetical protein
METFSSDGVVDSLFIAAGDDQIAGCTVPAIFKNPTFVAQAVRHEKQSNSYGTTTTNRKLRS